MYNGVEETDMPEKILNLYLGLFSTLLPLKSNLLTSQLLVVLLANYKKKKKRLDITQTI